MQYEVEVNGRLRQLNVRRVDGRFTVSLDGEDWHIDAARVDLHTLSLLVDARPPAAADGSSVSLAAPPLVASHEIILTTDAASGRMAVLIGAVPQLVTLNGRRRGSRKDTSANGGGGPQRLVAPMPGKVLRILVAPGQAVTERQPLVVVEAMKMENELRVPADGVVTELHVREGQSVDAGTLLLVLGPADKT